MKTFTPILAMVIVLHTAACLASYPPSNTPGPKQVAHEPSPQQARVSLQIFYDQLSHYGTWVSYNKYGYVWRPNAGPNFYPYATNGHWVFTDVGWAWYSDYSWGWAPFHYGRWFYDNYYGWMWVPDTEWGPAWVAWRSGGDYYGWAPLEPGISIGIVLSGSYQVPRDRWIFVRTRDIERPNVYSHTVSRTNNTTIINTTTIIQNTRVSNYNNSIYITGPDRNDVQRVTGRPVRQVTIQENTSPGQHLNKRELKIYRPDVQHDENDSKRSAPANVENLKTMKPVSERYQGQRQRNQDQNRQSDQNNGKQNQSGKKVRD